jgi:hypothetical protein
MPEERSYLEKLGLSENGTSPHNPYEMFHGKMPTTEAEAVWVANMAEAAMQGLLARPYDENDSTIIATACWKFALMALEAMPYEIRELLEINGPSRG